jgi:hypothetical protein
MKAKELAELLLQYQDFELEFCRIELDGSNCFGMKLREFEATVGDGKSCDRVVKLGLEEEL